MSSERRRAADQVRLLEGKVKHVQDMLVVKMREVSVARESQLPLKAEIEALKAMLEEEERRSVITARERERQRQRERERQRQRNREQGKSREGKTKRKLDIVVRG